MKALKIVGAVLGLGVVLASSVYGWASWKSSSMRSETYDVHEVDLPVPFPLAKWEVAAIRAKRAKSLADEGSPVDEAQPGAVQGTGDDPEGDDASDGAPGGEAAPTEAAPAADPLEGVDLEAVALFRARTRGKHLVEARYACLACHGADFGGGTMVDDSMIGTIFGPNISSGKGGHVAKYAPKDWDRIVRHGVLPDGRPALMPSEDFKRMSDQELSDIIAYVTSMPPVDREMAPPALGPLGKFLMATGKLQLSADLVDDHHATHEKLPPAPEPTAEFGAHLAAVCVGCHRRNFEGGPIAAGPPDWVPASNLTLHESGLAGWDYEAFASALRTGVRHNGEKLRMPMTEMLPLTGKMSDVELRALWAFIESLPKVPVGT